MSYIRRIIHRPQIVEIYPGHVLHRSTLFARPLTINGIRYTSPEHLFNSIVLAQHNIFPDAINFWKYFCPEHRTDPSQIRQVIEGYFKRHNVAVNAQWLVHAFECMCQVIITILENNERDFVAKLRSYYDQNHLGGIRFVEVTRSHNERVWSCGHKRNGLPANRDFSGSNLYGEIISMAYEYFFRRQGADYFLSLPPIDSLLSRCVYNGMGFSKTAVIISDSTFRHASAIEGGEIWMESGYTFHQLANEISRLHGNLLQFKFVVVAAGTNDAKLLLDDQDRRDSWQTMAEFLKPLRNHPYSVVLINTGIGVPSYPNMPSYIQWFKEAYRQDFGEARNFHLLDWATVHDENHFLRSNGDPNVAFLDHEPRRPQVFDHPNVSGTRKMWRTITKTAIERADMRAIRLFTTSQKYVIPTLKDKSTLA